MKLGLNSLIPTKQKGFSYPLFIFITGTIISILCSMLQHTCISDTIFGDILKSLFSDGNQLFLVSYTFLVLGVVEQLSKIITITLKNIKVIGLVFYAVTLFLYVHFPFFQNNSIDAKPVLNSLFYAFLGWYLKPVK